MSSRAGVVCVAALVGGLALLAGTSVTTGAAGPRIVKEAELADLPLGPFFNALVPPIDQIVDDHGVRFGSLGSDIFQGRGDSSNGYWTVTDPRSTP